MSINLDPREVLKYLNQLGYCNITKEQLKEFIHDLKKLVLYDDAKKNACEGQTQNNLRPRSMSARPRPPRMVGLHMGLGDGSKTLEDLIAPCNTSDSAVSQSSVHDKENIRSLKQQENNNQASTTTPTINSSRPSTSEGKSCSSNSTSSSLDIFNQNAKRIEGSRGSGTSKLTKVSAKTSFIRPWRLVSAPVKSVPDQRRTDPVSLYHHYQTIWKRQKLPGEDNHAELRWSIRERMLGQDPHPRPVSQASSMEHMKRHQSKK